MILHYNKIFFHCISVFYELLYTYFVSIIDCRIKGNTSAFRLNHLFGAHWCVLNSIWNLSPPTVCRERDANILLHCQWLENASKWQIFSRRGEKKRYTLWITISLSFSQREKKKDNHSNIYNISFTSKETPSILEMLMMNWFCGIHTFSHWNGFMFNSAWGWQALKKSLLDLWSHL